MSPWYTCDVLLEWVLCILHMSGKCKLYYIPIPAVSSSPIPCSAAPTSSHHSKTLSHHHIISISIIGKQTEFVFLLLWSKAKTNRQIFVSVVMQSTSITQDTPRGGWLQSVPYFHSILLKQLVKIWMNQNHSIGWGRNDKSSTFVMFRSFFF